jgi:hypothetical protein
MAVEPLVADLERSASQRLWRKLLHGKAERLGSTGKPPVADGLAS